MARHLQSRQQNLVSIHFITILVCYVILFCTSSLFKFEEEEIFWPHHSVLLKLDFDHAGYFGLSHVEVSYLLSSFGADNTSPKTDCVARWPSKILGKAGFEI